MTKGAKATRPSVGVRGLMGTLDSVSHRVIGNLTLTLVEQATVRSCFVYTIFLCDGISAIDDNLLAVDVLCSI